jgi:hypothetical protein
MSVECQQIKQRRGGGAQACTTIGVRGEKIGTGLTRAEPRDGTATKPASGVVSVVFVVHGSHDDDAEVDVLRRLLLRKECVVPTAHWFVAAKSMGLNFSFCRGVFVERGLRKLRAAAQ